MRPAVRVQGGNCGCDAHCATVGDGRGEPSAGFRLRPSRENGTWSVSADRIFARGKCNGTKIRDNGALRRNRGSVNYEFLYRVLAKLGDRDD